MNMNDAAATWTWSNFTWSSSSAAGTISWRIYYNDTTGNTNGTDILTFFVCGAPASGDFIIPSGYTCTCDSKIWNYQGDLYVYGILDMRGTCNITFTGTNRNVYVYSGGNIYIKDTAGFNKP
jgi:hypothetical protein